jgi:hypothetical protein
MGKKEVGTWFWYEHLRDKTAGNVRAGFMRCRINVRSKPALMNMVCSSYLAMFPLVSL